MRRWYSKRCSGMPKPETASVPFHLFIMHSVQRMHVLVADNCANSHIIGTIDGALHGNMCTVHLIQYDGTILDRDYSTSALSPGAWGDIKHKFTTGSPDVHLIRDYIRHAADALFLKGMWSDLHSIADGDALCALYSSTACSVQQTIAAVLSNLHPIDGSYEWIGKVYSASHKLQRPIWGQNCEFESELIRQKLPLDRRCTKLFRELLTVELVVASVHDVLRVPFVRGLYLMPSGMIQEHQDICIGYGLYCATGLSKGSAVTQYDGVLVDSPAPSPDTTHYMSVQFGRKCISGVCSVREAVGKGGLSFANACARADADLVRHDADMLSRRVFGECHVPRVVISRTRHDIPAHKELFMYYRLQ